jgi:hypothetical protein
MPCSIAARICLPLALLLIAGSAPASAWWDRCGCCGCEAYVPPPPPVYIYDHSKGPTWTSNGWSYPPVGFYYPSVVPPPPPYPVVAPLPPPSHVYDRGGPRPKLRRVWPVW